MKKIMLISLIAATVYTTSLGGVITFNESNGYTNGCVVSAGMLEPAAANFTYVKAELNANSFVSAVVTTGQQLSVEQDYIYPETATKAASWVKDVTPVAYDDIHRKWYRSVDVTASPSQNGARVVLLNGTQGAGSYITSEAFSTNYVLDVFVSGVDATTGKVQVRRRNSLDENEGYDFINEVWSSSNFILNYDITHTLCVSYSYDPHAVSNQFLIKINDLTDGAVLLSVISDVSDMASFVGGTNLLRFAAGDLSMDAGHSSSFVLDNLSAAEEYSYPSGIFVTDNTLNHVYVDGEEVDLFGYENDGLMCYSMWKNAETNEGNCEFEKFDESITTAVNTRKRVGYSLLAGARAPDWLFQNYPMMDTATEITQAGITNLTYLPYITVNGEKELNEPFLTVWKRTVDGFALFLRNHTNRAVLSHVQMTGWPQSNGLEMQWHSDSYAEFIETFDENLYVEFCERIVDIWLDAFSGSGIPLGICYSDVWGKNSDESVRRDYDITDEIIRYALVRAEDENVRLVPMGLWMAWPAITDGTHPLLTLMNGWRNDFPGTQVACEGPMGTYSDVRYAPLSTQLQFAVDFDMAWVQLWYHDVVYEPYADIIKTYRPQIGGSILAGWSGVPSDWSATNRVADITGNEIAACMIWDGISANWGTGSNGSDDGDFGTFSGETDLLGQSMIVKTTSPLRIEVTNNGTWEYRALGFHFDAWRSFGGNANQVVVSVVDGDLTSGAVSTNILAVQGCTPTADADYEDFDVSLDGLMDRTLSSGESVVFEFSVLGGSLYVDNIALSGRVQ